MSWFDYPFGFFLKPILIALLSALFIQRHQILVVGLSVILGCILTAHFFSPAIFMDYTRHMPGWGFKDININFFIALNILIKENPSTILKPELYFLFTGTVACLTTLGITRLGNRLHDYFPRIILSILSIMFIGSVLVATKKFRGTIAQEPEDLNYSYDALIYLKTYYKMATQDFYTALVQAASLDSRLFTDHDVQNGIFHGWVYTPLYFRTPTIFYFWRFFTFGHATGIFYMAVGLSVGLLSLSYAAGKKLIGHAAIALPLCLAPYLMSGIIWANLFYPDWWASIALTAGIFFWILERHKSAAFFLFLAATVREVTCVFLVGFLILSLVKKHARLAFCTATMIFGVLYAVHYIHAASFIATNKGISDSLAVILNRITCDGFTATLSYQMFPYGYFILPSWTWLILSVWFWVKSKRHDLLVLTILMILYFTTASSSYWGQHLLPFVLFSAFLTLFDTDENTPAAAIKIL